MLSRERKAELVEHWKGETYLDLSEERNPGADEFAQGFNNGMAKARDLIYARLPALIDAMPEEGCGEAKPGSDEEWQEAVDRATAAIIQCKRDRHAPITGDERWEAKAALSARPPVTASDALPAPPSPRS